MALYKLIKDQAGATTGVLRTDGAQIPRDPDNRDWKEFQEWRQAGGNPDPADVVTLETLTVRKLARALIRNNVLTRAQIEAELDTQL